MHKKSFLIIIILVLLTVSCITIQRQVPAQQSGVTQQAQQPTGQLPSQDSSTYIDRGDFYVQYMQTSNPLYQSWQQYFSQNQLFEGQAAALNGVFKLPYDVPIVFGECGVANAYYDRENKRMIMCWEFIEYFYTAFQQTAQTPSQLGEMTLSTTLFVFYHELGHALINVYDLPITGREEDAADQLSTFIVAGAGGQTGELAVYYGALHFYTAAQSTSLQESHFAGEHSLDKQRFYNLVCWLYGKNPQGNAQLAQQLPERRTQNCPYEYQQLSTSWIKLLTPYTTFG